MVRRLIWMLGVLGALALAAPAAHARGVYNKLGFWYAEGVGQSCFTSLTLEDGEQFVLQAKPEGVRFGVSVPTPLRTARTGVLIVDGVRFDFAPELSEGGKLIQGGAVLDPRALAALRDAIDVGVWVDGAPVQRVSPKGTGLAEVLDALAACSRGETGWWGPGAGSPEAMARARGEPDPLLAKAADGRVYNRQGVWGLAVAETPSVCLAQARAGEGLVLSLIAGGGAMGFAIAADHDLPSGAKGRIETDVTSFDFEPRYTGRTYVAQSDPMTRSQVAALHHAQSLTIKVDGQVLVEADLENTGFADLLDEVADCSLGQSGWWGEGAKPPS